MPVGESAGRDEPRGRDHERARGSYSPSVLRLSRPDGSQELAAIEASLPKGLLSRLAGTPDRPDAALAVAAGKSGSAEQASPSCPAASRVGSVCVGAGAVWTRSRSRVAPTRPFRIKVRRQPGDHHPGGGGDLRPRHGGGGERAAGRTVTAQVSGKSDPIRPSSKGSRSTSGSSKSPSTSRSPRQPDQLRTDVVGRHALGTASAGALSNPFEAVNGEMSGSAPKLAFSLTEQTKRTGNPARRRCRPSRRAKSQDRQGPGGPAEDDVHRPTHVNGPCTRAQFAANAGPAKSILGTVTAYSPLLENPLTGPVYFCSNGGEREPPDLVADLNGQIHVTLVGWIDSVKVGKESSRRGPGSRTCQMRRSRNSSSS